MIRVVVVVGAVLTLACCTTPTTFVDGRFTDDKVQFAVGAPGDGWKQVTLPTANVAWYNEALSSSLMVNSHCDGVGDSPLEGLTSDLLMGMTEREIVSQERMEFARREALQSIATGKLDGVPRKLELFVLKKDGCVYDIVLAANPDTFDKARPALAKVRDGFVVDARRDRTS